MMLLAVVTFVLSFTVLMIGTRSAVTSKVMQQRLKSIRQPTHAAKQDEAALEAKGADDFVTLLGAWLERFAATRPVQLALAYADSEWTLGRFAILTAGITCGLAIVVVVAERSVMLAAGAGLLGAAAPYAWLRWKAGRRLGAFNRELPPAIDMIARALRAGHAMNSSMELVAEQAPEPIRSEFGRVFQQQKFGMRFREALLEMTARVPSQDLHFLVTAILVQKETGGDLTEILDRTSHVIRERVRIEGEVRTHTAQGRLTGWILGTLPVVMLGLINLMSPGYSTLLFHDPMGQKLLYAGAAMIAVGGLIIRKIVDVRV